ncbi:DUF5958 family protein [Streptomyces olivaceoviridis]|uniref:DUF5958 family protein n=1 Tax=Streptomyces olivaceoviridis TaxID=1921 RepID=UPI0033A435C3
MGDVPQPSGGRSTTCPRSGLAHITAADGRSGVARSGVKPTAYCSVMICTDPPRYGSAGLPPAEYPNAFRVLVSVFAVADTRRRETYCKGAADTHGTTCRRQPSSRSTGRRGSSSAGFLPPLRPLRQPGAGRSC